MKVTICNKDMKNADSYKMLYHNKSILPLSKEAI
jgi:hypothetical protein